MSSSNIRRGDFELITSEILGRGSYGNVFRCYKIDDKNQQYCAKIIKNPKSQHSNGVQKTLIAEQNMFLKLKNTLCDNIVKLIDFIQTDDEICLVMELCDLDLYNLFQNFQVEKKWFTREQQIDMIRQILKGASLLFENNIVHRDIKPQNILVKIINQGLLTEKRIYKIADFGFSKLLNNINQQQQMTSVGTIKYQAPEIHFKQNVCGKCDIFSYGIMFHQIVFNKTSPYNTEEERFQFFERIKQQPYKCQVPPDLDGKLLANLIQEMLIFDQNKRISFERLLSYEIFLMKDPLFKPLSSEKLFQQIFNDDVEQNRYNRIYKLLDNLYGKSKFCQNIIEQQFISIDIIDNINLLQIYYLILKIGFEEIKIAFSKIHLIISDFQPKILKFCDVPHFLEQMKLYLKQEDQKFKQLNNKIKIQYKFLKDILKKYELKLIKRISNLQSEKDYQNYKEIFSLQKFSKKYSIKELSQQLQILIESQETSKHINSQTLQLIQKVSKIENNFDFFEYNLYQSDQIIQA